MKLKRLDIHGFKSFYHRTTLAFDEGITAVVGPNGCGKSNIVDSIKWVMGEQGAKSLRGDSMEDVIFAGSEKRGPMGICEVRLTFTNDGRVEMPARWREVEELAIERRLERGAGSDYLINKQRCRLGDIQEMVAGSGVGSGPGGRRAYAIIEQGRIGGIVSSRAEERRLLIEEAAGITRYRDRRRQAERKMEETRLNLERIEDVVDEVERNLKSLRRQAKRAERYKAYRDEARGIGLKKAVFEFLAQSAQQQDFERRVEQAITAEADRVAAVEATEARRTAAAVDEKTADAHVRAVSERLSAVEGEVRIAEADLKALEREAATLERQLDTLRVELEQGAGRRVRVEARLVEATERRTALEAEAAGEGEGLSAREAALEAAQRRLVEARQASSELRKREAEETRAIERARSARDAARTKVRDLEAQLQAAEEDRARQGAQRADVEPRLEAARQAVAEAEAAITTAGEAKRAAEVRLAEARTALDEASREERTASEAIAGARSRLGSLEELERRREGLGEGVKAVLDGRVEGVLGPVPEVLEVPAALEAAVAAALGPRLAGLVVADLDSAVRAVRFLQGRGRGRGVFASRAVEAPARPPAPPADPGICGLLADLLPAGEHAALVARLVGDALVAEDLEAALRVAREGWSGPVVTLAGQRLDAAAVVTGGADTGDAAPLSRRREIKELRGRIEELDARRAAAQGRVAEARQASGAARQAIDEAGRATHAAELRRTGARKDLHRAEADAERLSAVVTRIEERIAHLQRELEAARGRVGEAEAALAEAEGTHVDRARAIAEAESAAHAAEAARDEAMAALHQARTAAVARKARLEAARDEVRRLEEELREVGERADRAGASRGEVEARLAELATQRAAGEQRLAAARTEAGERATALAEARAAHDVAAGAVQAAEAAVTEARRARDAARDALAEARMALQACSLRLEHLEEAVGTRFQVTLSEVLPELADQPPPTDEETRRLAELERLIDQMGDVNPGAIEECEQVEQRHAFLVAQRQDMLAALDDLQRAIEQMNRTSRALFKETFDAVNERFRVLFPRLFRGGEADLVLTDPDDLLETGIEMLVSPPGKKVQNVSLLSGGEKAMCAIALVFAVFQVKPSPFCLLDEVDAPLDDANIGRFNEIVREMSQTSQIVLITHNKRTMEIADVLYGITMEEEGISKLVSVRMT